MNRRNVIFLIITILLVAVAGLMTFSSGIRNRKEKSHMDTPLISDAAPQIIFLPTGAISKELDSPSNLEGVNSLMNIFKSSGLSEAERMGALEKLYAARRTMTDEELRIFWADLLEVAKEQGLSAKFHSGSLWVLNEIGLFLKHKGIFSSDEVEEQVGFLVDLSINDSQALAVRRMAITALGDLEVTSAVPMLTELLSDEENWNVPELARSASISLSRLDPEQALLPVSTVLANTTNNAVFGSVAYSLREINSPEVLAVLTENRHRLEDNLSVDNTITELFPVVIQVLNDHSSPYISSAIDATQSLWLEEQRETVLRQLAEIAEDSSAPPAVRQQALARLLDASKTLHQKERQELLVQLKAIANDPLFSEDEEPIQRELRAKTLAPKK